MKPDPPDCPLHELPMIPKRTEGSREAFRCPNPNCSIEYDRPPQPEKKPAEP